MANIGWSFYRSRRRIDLRKLVKSGRVFNYPTYVAYCSDVHVIPATETEFASEFGPLLEEHKTDKNVAQPPIVEPPVQLDSNPGLQATVWLAGVDEGSERPASSPPPRVKKKKAKDSDPEGET